METSDLLFPYQREILSDDSKMIVIEKSRRIGGTWTMALLAILDSLQHDYNVWFSSSDEKNAKEFIAYVVDWLRVLSQISGNTYFSTNGATTEVVPLPNGQKISALSSNPRALRGKDGLIILDEMALHDDQRSLLRAAQGCVLQRGRLICLSTHDGPGTIFNQLITQSPSNGWSKHTITLQRACDEGYVARFAPGQTSKEFIDKTRLSCISEDAFNQEFMCQPLSLKSLISPTEYDALAFEQVPDHLDPDRQYHPLYFGLDVGRSHDQTVLWVVEQYINPKATGTYDQFDYKSVCILTLANMDIPSQYARLKPIIAHPSINGGYIDMGTVGRTLSDLITDAFPHTTAFSFTAPRKAILAERVKGFVSYRRVSLTTDAKIREDLLSLQRQASPSGNVSYGGSTPFSHCDAFWALALALEAAEQEINV